MFQKHKNPLKIKHSKNPQQVATPFPACHFRPISDCLIFGGLYGVKKSTQHKHEKIRAKVDIYIFRPLWVIRFRPNIGASLSLKKTYVLGDRVGGEEDDHPLPPEESNFPCFRSTSISKETQEKSFFLTLPHR